MKRTGRDIGICYPISRLTELPVLLASVCRDLAVLKTCCTTLLAATTMWLASGQKVEDFLQIDPLTSLDFSVAIHLFSYKVAVLQNSLRGHVKCKVSMGEIFQLLDRSCVWKTKYNHDPMQFLFFQERYERFSAGPPIALCG